MSRPWTTGAERAAVLANKWTAGEDDLIRSLAAQGIGAKRIAAVLGTRSHHAVSSRMYKLGITSYVAPRAEPAPEPAAPVSHHPAIAVQEHLRDRPLAPALQAKAFNGRVWRAA